MTSEELIPEDHICRVIDVFVDRLDMAGLGFERADPADTGRPGTAGERLLTTVAQKPSIEIEQAISSYSFRSPELSQPI